MSDPYLRTMGLTAPLSVALDPAAWRANYVGTLPLGPDPAAVGGTGFLAEIAAAAGDAAAASVRQAIADMPDPVIAWHLRCAASELAVKLGIPLALVVIKSPPIDTGLVQGIHFDKLQPRRPYTHGEGERWYRIDLHGPILSVDRVRAYYYGQLVWEFSAARNNIDLVRVEWPTQGSMHLLPINMQSVIVTQGPDGGPGNYGVWHTLGLHRSPVPDFWAVDYTIGPVDKETGTPLHLELVLVNWIQVVAAQTILGIAGMNRTRGLTSASVSFDGLSRSIGLAASAQAGIYGALEATFRRIEERIDWKQLRTYKRGLRVRMLSY